MSWNPFKDGISYDQLDKELRDLIDDKVSIGQYISYANEFSAHKDNSVIHLMGDDRERFEYAYKRVKEMLDGGIEESITDMVQFNTNFANHKNDKVVHLTQDERNQYASTIANINSRFNSINDQINGINDKFDEYVTRLAFSEHVLTLSNHLIDMNPHITNEERNKWNKIEENMTNYTNGKLTDHENNTEIHIRQTEREKWNQHSDNQEIHVTLEEKGRYDNHVTNVATHITNSERLAWNKNIVDTNAQTERLNFLVNTVNALSTTVKNLENQIARL